MIIQSPTEAVELYSQGVMTRLEMYAAVLRLMNPDNVDEIVASLPVTLQKEFIVWAQDNYGSESYSGDSVFLGGEGYEPLSEEIVQAVRNWLQQKVREE